MLAVVKEAINSETLDDVSSKLIAGRIPDNQDFIIEGKVCRESIIKKVMRFITSSLRSFEIELSASNFGWPPVTIKVADAMLDRKS